MRAGDGRRGEEGEGGRRMKVLGLRKAITGSSVVKSNKRKIGQLIKQRRV